MNNWLWYLGTLLLVLVLVQVAARTGIFLYTKFGSKSEWRHRSGARFAKQSTTSWFFAFFKLRMDAMFEELPAMLAAYRPPSSILDIGSGFGITASAMAEWYPGVKIYGIDPSPGRARAASGALADRGCFEVGAAPDFLPAGWPREYDLIVMLDVSHFLDDKDLALTLTRISQALAPEGRAVIRAVTPPRGDGSFHWRFEAFRRKLAGLTAYHRDVESFAESMSQSGLRVIHKSIASNNPEQYWFIAEPARPRQ